MKNAYTKLMLQQHTSEDAAFYKKLEKSGKVQKPVWKVAVVAACILLMIPVTVLAAKYILHKPQVAPTETEKKQEKIAHYGTFKNMETIKLIGYEVSFPDVTFFSIDEVPETHRYAESDTVSYDSWRDAADALNIGILQNSFLSSDSLTATSCKIKYDCLEEQPYAIYQEAKYQYDHLVFTVTATIGIDHPNPPEGIYEQLRVSGSSMAYQDRPSITNKEYITADGIPVIISKITTPFWYQHNFALYQADFAVNNIIYNISFPLQTKYNYTEHNYIEETEDLLLQILEGFTL